MRQTNILSAPASAFFKRTDRPIGAILVEEGRLTAEDANRILDLHHARGLRFGEAGKQLRLLSQADIDYALSRQFDYPYLLSAESNVSQSVIAAYDPFGPQVEALRALRNQLMLRWAEADVGRKALAVMSPTRQEGRSFVAANLAVVFSQLGERTLLIDCDMRSPSQHRFFGLDNRTGMSAILCGRDGPDALRRIPGLQRLSVLPSGAQPPNPLELLSKPAFPKLLQDLAQDYDVILVDTPPAADYADAQTIAGRAGAALIVARRDASRISQIRSAADAAVHAGATVVGTVLNG
jgi:receptor protein-tyrosine kinase